MSFNPEVILYIFDRVYEPDADNPDESTHPTRYDDPRMTIRSIEDVPWFFEKFPEAMRAFVRDTEMNPGDVASLFDVNDIDDGVKRVRPIGSTLEAFCGLIWSMQYFALRRYNSAGQRVNLSDEGSVDVNDDFVAKSVRNNELASFLYADRGRYEYRVSTDQLKSVAKRNVFDKFRHFYAYPTVAGTFALVTLGLGWCVSFVGTVFRDRSKERTVYSNSENIASLRIFFVLILCATLIVPLLFCTVVADCELDALPRTFDIDGPFARSIDGSETTTIGGDAIDDVVGALVTLITPSEIRDDRTIDALRSIVANMFRDELEILDDTL